MFDWWNALPLIEQVFFFMAIPATVILLIQTVLLIFGGGDDVGLDSDTSGLDGGFDVGDGSSPHTDNHAFDSDGVRIFTVRGIMAFFTVGGWAGVVAVELGLPDAASVVISAVLGLLALFGIAKLIQVLMKLQETGNIDPRKALGQTGQVYLTIPAESAGQGKINIMLGDSLSEFEAITYDKQPIKTGSRVRVVDIVGKSYVVEKDI